MQPLAEKGVWLDDRYRLEVMVRSESGASLWRAIDEVLERTVAVRIIPGQTKAQCRDLTAAAARAGRVPDARWVRVLDVGSAPDGELLTVWVVSEWVEGTSLATTVRGDPLRGPAATQLIVSCAQAVAAAEQREARHGALHPDEVLLPSDGTPRLTGLELAVALRPSPSYDDARGLGGLLYAALTGRWPLPGWSGLPSPSRGDGLHPRQQRGGVSRELDDITARALSGGYRDAAALVRDLSALPMAPLHPVPRDPIDRSEQKWRKIAWRVVPPLVVVAIGITAWETGSDLGKVPSPARAAAPSFPQPKQAAGAATKLVWSTPPHITSFDPEGDGSEDPAEVGLAVDDDPSTQWQTEPYRDRPNFGGLKSGVGLLLDLGKPTTVKAADLLLSAAGSSFQLRAGAVAPRQASDLPVVASRTNAGTKVTLALKRPVTARYWLLWITSLPRDGADYRLGVAEIALLR